jgi:hypothetical protein
LYLWLFGSVEVVHNKTLPTPKVTRHKFGGSVYPLVPGRPPQESTDSWEQPPGGSMARSAAFPVFTEFLHERDLLCLVASRSLSADCRPHAAQNGSWTGRNRPGLAR